ncbi:MAG: RNA methyltransferase [Mucinivorans sp.]
MKVILDNVRSALNVGSIFRTCDAMGVEELVLCGITATPPSREVHKTALGAELTVPYKYCKSTIEAITELKAEGYQIVAIEQDDRAVMLQNFATQKNQKYAYILGNEVDGVAADVLSLCETVIEIPQVGLKKSLNVSVAAGIVMWTMREKI